MANLNNCQFIGTLGRDPEIRYMPNGEAVANFSIAINESWKDKSGEKQERTEWVNVVAYRKLAEIIGEYCKKGQQIYIAGKMQTRKWEKDGVTRYTTEIIGDQMQMLGGKLQQSEDENSDTPQEKDDAPQSAPPADNKFENFEDDIPF